MGTEKDTTELGAILTFITKYIECFYNQQRIQKGPNVKTSNQIVSS